MAVGIKYSLAGQSDTTNILDYSTWTPGETQATGFSRNGLESENLIITDRDPFGEYGPIWMAYNTDIDNNGDGGWNTPTFSIDNTKLYRYSVWIKDNGKATTSSDGRVYFGCSGHGAPNDLLYRSTGVLNSNAYFDYSFCMDMGSDEWRLWVGHIWPAGSGTGAKHTDSNIYLVDGSVVDTLVYGDYVWQAGTTSATERCYFFYATTPEVGVEVRFAFPRVEIVDGSEPSIKDLLNGWGAYAVTGYDNNQGNYYLTGAGANLGDTSRTRYWSRIPPPSNGYSIYEYKGDQGPSIHVFTNETDCINYVNSISGESFTLIGDATDWIETHGDKAWEEN